MIGFIIFELILLGFVWIFFLVLLSVTRVRGRFHFIRWWKSPMASQIGLAAVLGLLETVALIALGTNHTPPLWMYAVLFGLINLLTMRWVYLTWQARKRDREEL